MESIHQGYASWSNSLARFAGLRRNRQTAFTQSGIVATYSYAQNSSFVSGIVLQNSVSTVLTTAKTYDNLNRLQSISQSVGSKTVSSCAYTNNVANQRVRALLADGSYWLYEYNDKGEVISGKRYWSNGSPVVGQQFEYAYDDIGNRISTNTNGQPASYTANNLNQYTERQVPRNFAVVGSANPTATVTVDGSATSRHGSYFAGASSVSGTSSANKLVTITGVKPMGASGTADVVIITTGTTFVPGTPETFTHDLDGNLTGDGRWTYTWDAENRLVQMDTIEAAVAAGAPRQRLQFTYDWQGRRVQKVLLESSDGTNYTTVSTTRFLYDGWNLIAELDGANSLVRSYFWGLDLSGSPQGAGGVGGLLTETVFSGTSYYPYYDGNGNVLGLVDFSGSSVAVYDYGPFGEPVRVSGAMALQNPFRFSTKYTDDETGLVYYGKDRYCIPPLGRWASRDHIEEAGGENLYGFVNNDPIGNIDSLGELIYWSSISLSVAKAHYQGGTQEAVQIDFNLVDTSKVKVAKDFTDVKSFLNGSRNAMSCKAGSKKFTDARYGFTASGTGDASTVLGDITLKFQGDVKVKCDCKYEVTGTLKSFDDTYDFNTTASDWFHRNPIRNVLTVAGSVYNGSGKSYSIQIRGSKQISETGSIGLLWNTNN